LKRLVLGRFAPCLAAAFVCLGVAAYGVLTAWVTPVSARVHYDPALQYMLSSLSAFRGETYAYIDHPGTPVELLGTLVLALSFPFTGGGLDGFITYQLTNPQQFLSIAQTLIGVASIGVCVLLARCSMVAGHWSQSLAAGAIAGLFFAVLPQAFQSLATWSHESFCFAAGTLLSLGVLLVVRRSASPAWRVVVGLGFASGVLTSVQLYFAAWVVGAAVALSVAARLGGASWRASVWRAAALAAMAGVGFVVATLPIHDHYRQLAGWIWLVVSHQGIYGAGPVGLPGPDVLAANLGRLIVDARLFFIACGAGMALLLWRLWLSRHRPSSPPGLWAAGLGFAAQILVLLVLVAKHPGVRYLLPVAATLPLVFATALDGLDPQHPRIRQALTGFGLGALALFAASLWSAMVTHAALADELERQDVATESMLVRLAQARGISRTSIRALWTYGTTSRCYALWFGDDSANRAFATDIARICPFDANLNIWSAKVASGAGDVTLADYPDWDVSILPEDLARALPHAVPPGRSFASSIDSLGFGQLLFVVRD
jgi:hypothetical protein